MSSDRPIDKGVAIPVRDRVSHMVGNRFWEARTKHGRDKLFANPEVLWEACVEYFEWMEANPLYEAKAFGGKEGPSTTDVRKMRAMSIGGLCLFLDISTTTWWVWAKTKDFAEICARVDGYIRDQKFTGAAADLLNPAIIARDLGLIDKREIAVEAANGTKTVTEDMTPLEAAQVWVEVIKSENLPLEDKSDE